MGMFDSINISASALTAEKNSYGYNKQKYSKCKYH